MDNTTIPIKKIAVVLDESLACGIALNTTAHMLMSLGSHVPEAIGKNIVDKSGDTHSGIPIYPNVILKAKGNKIRELVNRCRIEENLIVVDYPKYGFFTNTDEEYVSAVSGEIRDSIVYYGVAIYGDTAQVRALTKTFSLWR